MSTADDTTIRRDSTVNASQQRAFDAFTKQFGDFKPKQHNLMGSPIAETRFDDHVGGHIYDVAEDGSECRWARVLAYEPPSRVVFSWDISPYWQIEADETKTSEVEVNFIPDGPDRTRVELEHRHLDRHGDGWEGVRDGIANEGGWPTYLVLYADVIAQRG